MGHYAIALKYNFEPNNPEGVITEYFLPFSVEELSNLELYDFTTKALRKIHHTEFYPLDSFVKLNELEESENIVWLEDNEIRENEAKGLLGSDNYGEEFLAYSLWNLLSEARVISTEVSSDVQGKRGIRGR